MRLASTLVRRRAEPLAWALVSADHRRMHFALPGRVGLASVVCVLSLDSWTMTYDLRNPDNDIYTWLMSHKKQ